MANEIKWTTTVRKTKNNVITNFVPKGLNGRALIWRVYNYLMNNTSVTGQELARRFRMPRPAITATLRDLRKKGFDIDCQRHGGEYVYSIAA